MKGNVKTLLFLHGILFLYSCCGIFSKLASQQAFFTPRFILYYGVVLLLLFIYAILWQRVIKRLPLTTAFANKAVTVIWGIVFGFIFFQERLTLGKIAGAALIIVGIVLYTQSSDLERGNAYE